MNETTARLFESHEVRKTKKQKSAFIDFVSERAEQLGYECKVERGSFGARNISVGDVNTASVVYTAHYDTCPRLPFPNFITPKTPPPPAPPRHGVSPSPSKPTWRPRRPSNGMVAK